MTEPLAILPIKSFDEAKQRLSDALDPNTRRVLAEAMFSDVLVALRRSTLIESVLVVSGDHGAQRIAAGYGATVIEDAGAGAQRGRRARDTAGGRARRPAGAADPRRLPAAGPRRARRAARPPGRDTLGGGRSRPPRDGHQRTAAHAAGRARARIRTRQPPTPRSDRRARGTRGADRRGWTRWRSTSTRPRT